MAKLYIGENIETAMELVLLAANDYDIYKSRVEPITKNLQRKMEKGIFNQEKAVKLVMYLMNDVAKKYAKVYCDISTPWYKVFTVSDRKIAAEMWVDDFLNSNNSPFSAINF